MRRIIKLLFYFSLCIVLVFVLIEMAFYYHYQNMIEINMTVIEQEQISMKLAVRKAKMIEQDVINIPFSAKEGPFWFSVNENFTDLQIRSCRNTSLMVVYSCYNISSKTEKEKLLGILKSHYQNHQ